VHSSRGVDLLAPARAEESEDPIGEVGVGLSEGGPRLGLLVPLTVSPAGSVKEGYAVCVLTDTDLRQIIEETRQDDGTLVITPFDPNVLTPVGYDFRVGDTYSLLGELGRHHLGNSERIEIRPGTTALVETLEAVEMPKDLMLSGLITSKVSLVSRGLSHISTTIDPDWEGKLLIAVHNHSRQTLELEHGRAFCTAVFVRNCSSASEASGHLPSRPDILLKNVDEDSARIVWRKRLATFLPIALLVGLAGAGYAIFRDPIGFSASIVVGVALSQLLADRLR